LGPASAGCQIRHLTIEWAQIYTGVNTCEGLLETIAQEIVDDLEAALEQFRLIAGDLASA
jgi:hypothetical protein